MSLDRLDDPGGRGRRSLQLRQGREDDHLRRLVELVKGTDGLLHISNVKPGERVDSVDDVLTAGEAIDVTVVEVDKERGRIGLRLSDDPSVAGKSPEELASVGSGGGVAAAATAVVAVDATAAPVASARRNCV